MYNLVFLISFLILELQFSGAQNEAGECGSSLKPQKLSVVGIWERKFDNDTSQYRISDEDLSVRGYQRSGSDKASSTVMLARHPEGCVVSECGVRLTAMIQKNGAILHTDNLMLKRDDGTMSNIEDEFYCAKKNNTCGADVPIYRLVKHTLSGPHYAYSFDTTGQSFPGYEKEFFPLCYAWRQTPSVVLFNSTDDGVCLTLSSVDNGKIAYSTQQSTVFSIGTTAILQCHHGFAGTGQSHLVCTKEGWYPKSGIGKCLEGVKSRPTTNLISGNSGRSADEQSDGPVTTSSCAIPKSIPNGNIVYSANVAAGTSATSVPTATRATVLCSIGFVPSTSATSSRCVDTAWIPSLPSCLSLFDIKCPILGAPTNGELVFTNSSHAPYGLGSVISLKCDRNYFGIGNMTSTCSSGSWDKKLGHCEPITTGTACTAIATPANGNILYMQANPAIPYSSGTTGYLMCNLGMTLQNSISTLCQNGVWTPTIGTCVSSLNIGSSGGTCTDFPTPINGTVSYSSGFGSHPSGSSATLTCNFGTTVSGSLSSTCSNGVWSPSTLGSCTISGLSGGPILAEQASTCTNPMVINGQITYSQGSALELTKNVGTVATLICNAGYTISGSTSATCQSGTWTPTLGTCNFGTSGIGGSVIGGTSGLQCTAMLPPLYGAVSYSSGGTIGPFASGTVATATCTNGGIIQGTSSASCTSGMWNPAFLGTCSLGTNTGIGGIGGIGGTVGAQCGALAIPVGAQATYSPISLSTTSYNSATIATVTCTIGGTQLGTTTCTNGIWTPAITSTCNGGIGGTSTQCTALLAPLGATVTYQGATTGVQLSYNSGTVARVQCTNGNIIGTPSCLNGQWSPAVTQTCTGLSTGSNQCIGITPVLNGQITYSDGSIVMHNSGSIATLTCTNFVAVTGSSTSTCLNGIWTPTIGSCTGTSGGGIIGGGLSSGLQCTTAPIIPIGATVAYSTGMFAPFSSGTTGTMTCPLGQSVFGTSVTSCQNGVWSPTLGTCSGTSNGIGTGTGTGVSSTIAPLGISNNCLMLPLAPANGQILVGTGISAPYPDGTSARLECNPGYVVSTGANATSTCHSGFFSEITASCTSL